MPDLSLRIVYKTENMERVGAPRSVVYKSQDGIDLRMDIYTPPDVKADARLPVVLFVHGGPVPREMAAPTTWGIFQSYGALLAAAGLIAVTFNHRLHGLSDYERSQSDIADALGFVRAHAGELRADPERIGLWYFSGAGPQLSWLLREMPGYVRCAAAFYAMLDVRNLLPPGADEKALAAATALSPVTYLRSSGPKLPLFVARAGQDSPMVNIGLDAFVHAALATNAELDFMNHPAGAHSFECLTDDQRTRDILASAITFMRRHLTGGA